MSPTTCRRCQALYKTWADAWDVLQSLPLARESEEQIQLLHEVWAVFKEHVLFCSVVNASFPIVMEAKSLDLRARYQQAVQTSFHEKQPRSPVAREKRGQRYARSL